MSIENIRQLARLKPSEQVEVMFGFHLSFIQKIFIDYIFPAFENTFSTRRYYDSGSFWCV